MLTFMINSTFDTQFEIPDKIVFIWIFNVFLQFKGNRSIFNPNGLGTVLSYFLTPSRLRQCANCCEELNCSLIYLIFIYYIFLVSK